MIMHFRTPTMSQRQFDPPIINTAPILTHQLYRKHMNLILNNAELNATSVVACFLYWHMYFLKNSLLTCFNTLQGDRQYSGHVEACNRVCGKVWSYRPVQDVSI